MKSGAYTYENPAVSPKAGERAADLIRRTDFVRWAGSQAELDSANLLLNEVQSLGFPCRLESFLIPASTMESASLISQSGTEYSVTGCRLCGSTPTEGITAPFFYAEDGNEILLAQAKGCIVLLNSHPNLVLYRKLVKYQVAGFVSIYGTPIDKMEETDPMIASLNPTTFYPNEGDPVIPGVTIHYLEALRLLDESPDMVMLQVTQTRQDAQAYNVVAEVPGTGDSQETVVFCAHYDTVRYSHGSYDNMSGSAIILELCRFFAEHPPLRPLRFIWFSGEEQGLYGSKAYVRDTPKEVLDNIALVINVDLAGNLIGHHEAIVTADEGLCDFLRFLANEVGFGLTVSHDIFSSDSTSFADGGIPAMSFFRSGESGAPIHNRHDTAQWVSARSLKQSIDFLALFSEKLINSTVFPVPRPIPDKIKEKIDAYFKREKSKS